MTGLVEEIEALYAEICRGEWTVYGESVDTADAAKAELCKLVDGTPSAIDALYMLSVNTPNGYLTPAVTGCGRHSKAHATLLAALVNHWPTIKEKLESLAADNERLEDYKQAAAIEASEGDKARADAKALREALKELVRLRDERVEIDNTPCVEWTREHSNRLVRSNQAFHEAWINARSLSTPPGNPVDNANEKGIGNE